MCRPARFDDERSLHAGGVVTGERAQERVRAGLGRHREGGLDRFPRTGERRVADDLCFHRGGHVVGVARGNRGLGERVDIGARVEQHEVVRHRDLRHLTDVLEHDVQPLARLGVDGTDVVLHLVVAGDVDGPRGAPGLGGRFGRGLGCLRARLRAQHGRHGHCDEHREQFHVRPHCK
jgi:hypothetical protein